MTNLKNILAIIKDAENLSIIWENHKFKFKREKERITKRIIKKLEKLFKNSYQPIEALKTANKLLNATYVWHEAENWDIINFTNDIKNAANDLHNQLVELKIQIKEC